MKHCVSPASALNRIMLTTFLGCPIRMSSTLLCNGSLSLTSWQINGFRLNWRIGCYGWEVGLGMDRVEISNLSKDLLGIATWCEACRKLRASKHALLEVNVSNGSLNDCCLLPILCCQSSSLWVGFWTTFKAESSRDSCFMAAEFCAYGLLKQLCLLRQIVFALFWWLCTNLVDPASSHMLVSKIKPCMSQYKLLYGETANGSLKQL